MIHNFFCFQDKCIVSKKKCTKIWKSLEKTFWKIYEEIIGICNENLRKVREKYEKIFEKFFLICTKIENFEKFCRNANFLILITTFSLDFSKYSNAPWNHE